MYKMFQDQQFPICIPQVTHCSAFCKQGLCRINLSKASFCQLLITIRFETFLSYIASFWRDSGGKLSLFRYSTASQCISSSTLVLLTAFWMKLYSSATFLILQPQGLQTCSDKFSFLVNCNPAEPQQSAKISLAHLTLPDGENKFSNEARPPPEAKLSPQNLSLLFFF